MTCVRTRPHSSRRTSCRKRSGSLTPCRLLRWTKSTDAALPTTNVRVTPENRCHRLIDVVGRCRPVAHRDTHRCPALPHRAAEPAGAVRLDSRNDCPRRVVVVIKPDEDLVEHDIIENVNTVKAAQRVREPSGMRAATVDDTGDAGPTECAEGGVHRNATSPP